MEAKLLRNARPFRKAVRFTLIELLVVIAIISILAGMLLPALGQVKSTSRTVTCLSNQKQVNTFIQMYTSTFNDMITFPQYFWVENLFAKYFGFKDTEKDQTYLSFFCPAIPREIKTNSGKCNGQTYGVIGCSNGGSAGWLPSLPYINLSKIPSPSKSTLCADAFAPWVAREYRCYFRHTVSVTSNMGGLFMIHNKKANILAVDGHAASYSLNQINVDIKYTTSRYYSGWSKETTDLSYGSVAMPSDADGKTATAVTPTHL